MGSIQSLKKRNKIVFRDIPLPPSLVADIGETFAECSSPFWPISRQTAWRHLKHVMLIAGIDGPQANPNGLRHAFGIRAIASNVPLHMLQRWLGHADMKTTAIYAQAVGPEERMIAARMWGRITMHSYRNTVIRQNVSQGVGDATSNVTQEELNSLTLYKHCKAAHLPKKGGFIRIGTLSEYRTQENQAVADVEEGMFRVSLHFPSTQTISLDDFNAATLGTYSLRIGENQKNIELQTFHLAKTEGIVTASDNTKISELTKTHVKIKGTVDLLSEGADAFVLCFSENKETGEVIIDSDYKAVWSVKPGHLVPFLSKVRVLIGREIAINKKGIQKDNTIGPLVAPGFLPSKKKDLKFWVTCELSRVAYLPRKIEVTSNNIKDIRSDVRTCIDWSASIKPEEFSRETECRAIYRPCFTKENCPFHLLPNMLDPLFLPFDTLIPHLEIHEQGS